MNVPKARLQRVSIVLCIYSFVVWLYVIAMQLRYLVTVYWPFAQWIPIRMDYLAETAFLFSFIFAMIAATCRPQCKDSHAE